VNVREVLPSPGLRLVGGDDRHLLFWTGYRAGRYVIRAADLGASSPARTISDGGQNTVLADAAATADGAALVLGLTGIRGETFVDPVGVVTMGRDSWDAPFLEPEVLAEPRGELVRGRVAIDPRSGSQAAAWEDPAGGGTLFSIRDR
jgi:hypothetical protein